MKCPYCDKDRTYSKAGKKLNMTCGSKECISKLISQRNAGNSKRSKWNTY